jgi:hypothetical protein
MQNLITDYISHFKSINPTTEEITINGLKKCFINTYLFNNFFNDTITENFKLKGDLILVNELREPPQEPPQETEQEEQQETPQETPRETKQETRNETKNNIGNDDIINFINEIIFIRNNEVRLNITQVYNKFKKKYNIKRFNKQEFLKIVCNNYLVDDEFKNILLNVKIQNKNKKEETETNADNKKTLLMKEELRGILEDIKANNLIIN